MFLTISLLETKMFFIFFQNHPSSSASSSSSRLRTVRAKSGSLSYISSKYEVTDFNHHIKHTCGMYTIFYVYISVFFRFRNNVMLQFLCYYNCLTTSLTRKLETKLTNPRDMVTSMS